MKVRNRQPFILMVDDDPDDYQLTKAALKESGEQVRLERVADGEELLDYLFYRGKFVDTERSFRPSLILLDLNMPVKNGKEALAALKLNPDFRQIPVVVYTSSSSIDDIQSSYQMGASTYIPKPASFESLVDTMKILCTYWLDVAALPFSEAGPSSDRMRVTA